MGYDEEISWGIMRKFLGVLPERGQAAIASCRGGVNLLNHHTKEEHTHKSEMYKERHAYKERHVHKERHAYKERHVYKERPHQHRQRWRALPERIRDMRVI